ncbi:MAG: phosphotyrosine protein phosphatase [Nanoarchaeota archaeon]|nr:phosphotyrosine protein phosphatase [Nanoarchaeota archaeon]
MKKKNFLFICTANEQRSPTAEGLFKNNKQYLAKSCGIHPLAAKPITKEAILWADIIFCMEDIHKQYIIQNFPNTSQDKKIVVLNIPDIYIKNDPELVRILMKKLKDFLE